LVGNSESVEAGNPSGRNNSRGFYPILLVAAVGAVRCDGFKGHGSLDLALRMSPHDPQNVRIYMALPAAHYAAGWFTEAVGYGRQAVQQRQGFSGGHRIYVASLAQDGQIDEARTALDHLKELQPKISVAWIEQNAAWTAGPMPKYVEGMRKASMGSCDGSIFGQRSTHGVCTGSSSGNIFDIESRQLG
jgi:hypothetical protein